MLVEDAQTHNGIGICLKVLLLCLALTNTIAQFVGLVMDSWGCKMYVDDLCVFEGLFQTCLNGTCFGKARYNRLATLAFSSFFINALCLLTLLIVIWQNCVIPGLSAKTFFQKWTTLWKWIAIMTFISNFVSAVLFVLGVLHYERVFSLLVFSVPGVVVTLAFLAVTAGCLFYYAWHFVEFFTSEYSLQDDMLYDE